MFGHPPQGNLGQFIRSILNLRVEPRIRFASFAEARVMGGFVPELVLHHVIPWYSQARSCDAQTANPFHPAQPFQFRSSSDGPDCGMRCEIPAAQWSENWTLSKTGAIWCPARVSFFPKPLGL